MASMLHLSTELLDLILALLPVKDLASVAQSCKSLQSPATPFLYDRLSWTWAVCGSRPQPPVHLLLRTVSQRPDLARLIRHVKFDAVQYTKDTNGQYRAPALISPDREAILSKVPEFPEAGEWRLGIANGRVKDTIALLLFLLPELRSLDLGLNLQRDNTYLGIVLNFMNSESGSAGPFRCLERVRLSVPPAGKAQLQYSVHLPLDQFLPFFYCRTLLSAEILLPDVQDSPNRWLHPHVLQIPWPLPGASVPALTMLHINRSRASPHMLRDLTSITPQLRVLEYEYFCRAGDTLDTATLRAAFENVQGTLEHLEMKFEPHSSGSINVVEQGEGVINGSLGSLKSFGNLLSLKISLVILLGWRAQQSQELSDVLPATLQSITFRDDCWGLDDLEWEDNETFAKFAAFLDGPWRKATPDLKSFDLEILSDTRTDWEPPLRQDLRNICEKQGLCCKTVKFYEDKSGWPL